MTKNKIEKVSKYFAKGKKFRNVQYVTEISST
jgi:hypothetical protein